jgi:Na+-driven multidrug efflux pump
MERIKIVKEKIKIVKEKIKDFLEKFQIIESIKELFKIMVPLIIMNISDSAFQLIDFVFLGHLGKVELAASGVGNVLTNCFLFIPIGMIGNLDTLLTQR